MSSDASIRINADRIVRLFALIIGLLGIAHLVVEWLKFERGLSEVYGLVRQFDLASEANIPSIFNAALIAMCAALAATIGLVRRRQRVAYARHWLFLAAMLLFIAVDESAEIHELTIRPMRELFPSATTGLLFWGWVVPAGLMVLAVGVSYLRFVFFHLDARMRNACVIGASLFVGGALGVEMPEARHFQQHGDQNMTYAWFVLVEEVMEMSGMLVLLRGLFGHLAMHVGSVSFAVAAATAASATAPVSKPVRRPRREPEIGFRGAGGFAGALPARYENPPDPSPVGKSRESAPMPMHADDRRRSKRA